MTKEYYIDLLKNDNVRAALDTIARAEGVRFGYNTLYGNTKILSLDKHPNTKITKWGITSTAAGRYQFLFSTWSRLEKLLKLDDFGPLSQDIAALRLIDEKGAIPNLLTGDILTAVFKIRKVWASLPEAGYGQGERTKEEILKYFTSALENLKKKK